jgi:hypothetical protein
MSEASVFLFKAESKYNSEMQGLSEKCSGGIVDDGDDADDGQSSAPALLTLSQGVKVSKLLADGYACVAADGDGRVPGHMVAFRAVYCNDEADRKLYIAGLWRCMLPAHAQLWYRLYVGMALRLPQKLLVLLVADSESARQVAIELIHARDCCLAGAALAIFIRDAALEYSGDLELRIAFILSDFVLGVLKTWLASASVQVFDLECDNNLISRVRLQGRAPDFASLAAKVYTAQTCHNFETVTKQKPYDAHKAAIGKMDALVRKKEH